MTINRYWVLAFVATLLAAFLILIQHWGMTFTNADDPWIAQLGVQGTIDTAKTQGRFWLIPVLAFTQLPHLLDSWAFVNFIKILVNGLVFLSFVLFCSKLVNKYTGLLMGLVWLALIDINSSSYSPIHGFLLMFNMQFAFLFMSFYLFLDRLENNGSAKTIVTPYLLFAFALLAYEPMLFYSMVFPALYLYKQMEGQNSANKLSFFGHAKKFLIQNYTLVIVVVAYVILYLGFRKFFATGSRGIDAWGNPFEILKTIFNFSIHGFNIQLKPITEMVLEQYSTTSLVLAVLFASLVALGMFFLIPRIDENLTPSNLYKKKSLAVLGFFIFSPNILLSLVEGYRKWANYDPHYVGNYFSSFPLAMAIALVVLYLVGGDKSKNEKVLFVLILYVFFSSAIDNYLRWEKLATTNRGESVLWVKAINRLSQQTFDPQHQSTICGINAPKHVSGDEKYWSQYLTRKLSTNIRYLANPVSQTSCDVALDFLKD